MLNSERILCDWSFSYPRYINLQPKTKNGPKAGPVVFKNLQEGYEFVIMFYAVSYIYSDEPVSTLQSIYNYCVNFILQPTLYLMM